jgi:UDP-N-acetylmuramoyl-tripeptide--D-alanyl-D-alanine ligase
MKTGVIFFLKWLSKATLWRYRPKVIGITGSVGKTTTKDAIAFALSGNISLYATAKNYNNEIGVPLTILGMTSSPGKDFFSWFMLFLQSFFRLFFFPSYPKVLILEMGVDRPGDMDYLLSIVRPDICIVTDISSSHIEFFKTLEAIAQEKGKLVESLSRGGVAILNADNSYTWAMRKNSLGKVITYGFDKRASLQAFNDSLVFEGGFSGMRVKIEYKENVIPLRLYHIITEHHLKAILASLVVCDVLGINLIEVIRKLEEFKPPAGRFRVLEGIDESILIDDTYNASPASTREAISALKNLRKEHTVAVLGDMLELGKEEEKSHRDLAEDIKKAKINQIVLVGMRMKYLFEALQGSNFSSENLWWVKTPYEGAQIVSDIVDSGKVVLVKGSQSMRMEIIVENIMKTPENKESFLCRQNKEWKDTPFIQP